MRMRMQICSTHRSCMLLYSAVELSVLSRLETDEGLKGFVKSVTRRGQRTATRTRERTEACTDTPTPSTPPPRKTRAKENPMTCTGISHLKQTCSTNNVFYRRGKCYLVSGGENAGLKHVMKHVSPTNVIYYVLQPKINFLVTREAF